MFRLPSGVPPGEGDGQFSGLNDVIAGNDNSIYLPDYENYRIQKFSQDGQFTAKWEQRGLQMDNLTNHIVWIVIRKVMYM